MILSSQTKNHIPKANVQSYMTVSDQQTSWISVC